MKRIQKKFFHLGVDKQKKSDLQFLVSAPDSSRIQKWKTSQKLFARRFLKECEADFERWKKHLEEYL